MSKRKINMKGVVFNFDENGVLTIPVPDDIPGQKRARKRALKLVDMLNAHPMNESNKKK